MKSLRYHPLFADDVLEAAGWYGAQIQRSAIP